MLGLATLSLLLLPGFRRLLRLLLFWCALLYPVFRQVGSHYGSVSEYEMCLEIWRHLTVVKRK